MFGKTIFIFLDGFGLGKADQFNPFYLYPPLFLLELVGSPLTAGISEVKDDGLLVKGVDACLGVPGLPQSATGQTSLFTGINSQKEIGFHYPAFPDKRLIKMLRSASILKRARERGYSATFANSYTKGYFKSKRVKTYGHSATTHCVLAAGLEFRFLDDLLAGNAVCWDITNHSLGPRLGVSFPVISPAKAGRRLAGISEKIDLVLFECFLPDLVGHAKKLDKAVKCLRRIDEFLRGLTASVSKETTIVISSDHGNIEDLSHGIHTRNPVPFIVIGPGADKNFQVDDITDVADFILE